LPCENSSESNISAIKIVAPTFPTRPYNNKVTEGFVKLRIEVNSSGFVQNIKILESKPNRFFNNVAIKAIRKYKFSTSSKTELRCGIVTYDFKITKPS
jgi:protein TonB